MPLPRSTPRRTLIRKLKSLGYDGPYSGGRHSFMKRGRHKQRIPNEHEGDIDISLLKEILSQAGITEEEYVNA